uniref:Uncharacterized protein n=1 Tax=Anopheles culicifacies TaxID=139723 RepID=A0A182M2G0_9DIPT
MLEPSELSGTVGIVENQIFQIVDPVIEETRVVKPGKKANVSVHTVFYDSDGSDDSRRFQWFRRFRTVPDGSDPVLDGSRWNQRFLLFGIGTGMTPVGTGSESWVRSREPTTS